MLREITAHHGEAVNDRLHVTTNYPGEGGPPPTGYYIDFLTDDGPVNMGGLHFARAPGRNTGGILTNELLLAVLIDRLEGYQGGPLPCQETAQALKHARMALMWLKRRASERRARGALGRHLP